MTAGQYFARRRPGIRAGLLAGVAVGALAAAPAAAQSINTFPQWNGTSFISSWGEPNTATYGQTITPTASQRVLQNFTFSLAQQTVTPPNYQAFVYQWDPAALATRSGWSISGKIGGEFGSDIRTYNALGKVRYSR